MKMNRRNAEASLKAVALLLLVGGVAGVAIGIWTAIKVIREGSSNGVLAVIGCIVLAFGLCVWTGTELWQKKRRAYRWAQILLLAQIPDLSFPGFAYQFYTGLTLCLAWMRETSSTVGFQFELGSAINFRISSEVENFVLGVNIVAILALYLLERSRGAFEPQVESAPSR